MKTLVVYYSRRGENYAVGNIKEGNAEHIAKVIQKMTNADSYEIEPVKDYSKDYTTCTEEAMKEVKEQARPEFKNHLTNLDEYSKIYLCYPIWWGSYPRIVATFLDTYNFAGKIIKPMATHEGSGLGNSVRELRNALKEATIEDGLAIQGVNAHNSDSIIKRWVEE